MIRRALMVATVPSMIGHFNMDNINILLDMGYKVDVASDFNDISIWPVERTKKLKSDLEALGVECIQIDFSRNPVNLVKHVKSYNETIGLIKKRKYSFIHTHTPIASAVVRLAAHKANVKVIYTAHGFHFYDGAPLKNWLCFYWVEKILSKYTDVLITINKEDYARATKKFKAKKNVYVPGVGVNTEKYKPNDNNRMIIRNELGIDDKQIMILSVGEINENKNHERVIKAISGTDMVYVIAGEGHLKEHLKETASICNSDVRLVGFRTDINHFYNAADVYVLPSIREGLNVSLMEAMASGLAVACGRIRGNVDLIDSALFDPMNTEEIKKEILNAVHNRKELGKRNRERIKEYDIRNVNRLMRSIYESMDH